MLFKFDARAHRDRLAVVIPVKLTKKDIPIRSLIVSLRLPPIHMRTLFHDFIYFWP